MQTAGKCGPLLAVPREDCTCELCWEAALRGGSSAGQVGVRTGSRLASLQVGSLPRRGRGLLLRDHLVYLHHKWTHNIVGKSPVSSCRSDMAQWLCEEPQPAMLGSAK